MMETNQTEKVLYVMCYDKFSGAEIVMQRLIDLNKEVLPIIMFPGDNYRNLYNNQNTEFIVCKSLTSLNATNGRKIDTLVKFVKKIYYINKDVISKIFSEKIRIVHANNLAAAFFILPTVIFCRGLFIRKKFIWTNHDLTYVSGKIADKAATLCNFFFHKNIVVSEAVRNKFKHIDKAVVLYNGLDVDKFQYSERGRHTFRHKYELKDNEIAIGILGSIIVHKGQLELLKAYKHLTNQGDFHRVKIFIIGRHGAPNSDYSMELIQYVADNCSNSVHFIEHTNEIGSVYSGLDIVVNCTNSKVKEPLGTTIYEGQAFGKVVLASDTGGSAEIIKNGLNGFLYEADNRLELEKYLGNIINDYSKMDLIRDKARQNVLEKFSINMMVANYNNIIRSLF